jgi:branched-chain amino acid transport system substrate-binding protein
MKKTSIIALITVLAFTMVFAFSCAKEEEKPAVEAKKEEVMKAEAPQVYKLGLSLAITGPTSDAGNPYSKGVEDYIRYANETKILGEDTIDCAIRDDQYKTDVTKRNFEDFLAEGIVFYLNYSTGSTLGLKRDFEEEKMPVIPASFHAGNLDDSNFIFLPIASYSKQMIGLAEYVANNHKGDKPKVALFIHPSAFGRGPVEDTQKAVEQGLGIDIVEVVEHGKDLDNTAALQRLQSKGVEYVICHTVQSPVATLIKDAERQGMIAGEFGEPGKITFLGAHYTGGNDLIALAGSAANNYYWSTSYTLTSEAGPGTDAQLDLAKRYGRDDKAANSHNYTNGVMVAQIATEILRRAKASGKPITRESLYAEMLAMNGYNAFYPLTTVGPVTYSQTDKEGVDELQIYRVEDGVFRAVDTPFTPEFAMKM